LGDKASTKGFTEEFVDSVFVSTVICPGKAGSAYVLERKRPLKITSRARHESF